MTDAFVNVSVEERRERAGLRYYVVMDAGNGTRTTSPPFRTLFAANRRAEVLLAELLRQHPEADVFGGDEPRAAAGNRTASGNRHAAMTRHEGPRA